MLGNSYEQDQNKAEKASYFSFSLYQMIAEGNRLVNACNRFVCVCVHLVGFTK